MPNTFLPDAVFLTGNGNLIFRSTPMGAGDLSVRMQTGAGEVNQIQALNANGFQVGTDTTVNTGNTVYSYIAFKTADLTNILNVGTITPAGASFTVTGIPFAPAFVAAKARSATTGYWKGPAQAGATSTPFAAAGTSATAITSLTADGFTGGATISAAGVGVFWFACTIGCGTLTPQPPPPCEDDWGTPRADGLPYVPLMPPP
jgi:hypothetical protein